MSAEGQPVISSLNGDSHRVPRYALLHGQLGPLPAGFEIRFGGLIFQATGNGYLMRLTNREELRARRQAGPAPVAAARATATPTPVSTDAAGPSAPQRHRDANARQHGRCGSIGATAPPPLRPALAPGAVGATTC
jgi:hypothetical protein